MASSMTAAQVCGTVVDQAEASVTVLAESQNERFPYRIQAFGMEIEVHRNVFSPKHFHGWEVFTSNFPSVVGERVLEIGSGTGITAVHLAKRGAREVVAVDINGQAVENTQKNVLLNGVTNMEARVSDVFSGVGKAERFDTIYWNLPFIYMPPEYKYRNILERGLFDPGYMYTERFLAEAPAHFVPGGRILVGLGDFADMDRFMALATKYRYRRRLVASEPSVEVNPVEFRLYELKPFTKLFYAMPFTGRSHGEIVASRTALHRMAKKRELDLLEQFVGFEEEGKFESHGYLPLFIAKKDHALLGQADLVVVDYSSHSIGRDCETVIAKEVMDKRVIAVVPDPRVRNHPYVRLYSDYVVESGAEAFGLAQKLSDYHLPHAGRIFTRRQKDTVDEQVREVIQREGARAMERLFPTELRHRWEALFGDDYASLVEWSFKAVPKTVRANTLKTKPGEFPAIAARHGWHAAPHPVADNVFRLPPNFVGTPLGDTLEFQHGLFYVQDLASMLPVLVLDPQPGERVLDLGAAPGSKTTQMAERMRNQGKIVAVDVSEPRLGVLEEATARLGITIVEPRVEDATALSREYRQQFDRVLVDAPCSCEGILRYKPHKLFEWNLLSMYRRIRILKGLFRKDTAEPVRCQTRGISVWNRE